MSIQMKKLSLLPKVRDTIKPIDTGAVIMLSKFQREVTELNKEFIVADKKAAKKVLDRLLSTPPITRASVIAREVVRTIEVD